ncbi:hypothetical protein CYY_004634 [Polysphondylium violaceum]|uniref:non-specific serine/threonine protein kinase n=1 Tax=Polysphondylium violaceum TaxID=133409 RepID=A0A8J4PV00_9MYCE|nr:hypothetical protein CYY_004634 [Polysphondylium violaceum]
MNVQYLNDYIIQGRIGSGSFAMVYRAVSKLTGEVFAIKEVNVHRLTEKNTKLIENLNYEIRILKLASHPNIVTLYDVIEPPQSDEYMYLVMECCEGGDFSKYIRKHKRLTEEKALYFMRQLSSGLRFLRQKDIIHRDLKPQNLLLSDSSENPILKIGDFGFAKFIDVQSLSETFCGSPLYMAPEILNHKSYTVKADLWSVGVILYEMLVGQPPFNSSSMKDLILQLDKKTVRLPSSLAISKGCQDLLFSLLQSNEMERISWEDFFSHPWLIGQSPAVSYPIQTTTNSIPFNIKGINNNNNNSNNNSNNNLPGYSTSAPTNNININSNNNIQNNNNYSTSPLDNGNLPFAFNNSASNKPIVLSPGSSFTERNLNKSKSFTENNQNNNIRYPFKDDKGKMGSSNGKNSNSNSNSNSSNSNSNTTVVIGTTTTTTTTTNPTTTNALLDFERDCVILDDQELFSTDRVLKRATVIAELGDLRQYEAAECLPLYLKALNMLKSRIPNTSNNNQASSLSEKFKSTFKEYQKKAFQIYSTLNSDQDWLNPQFSANKLIYETALDYGRKAAVEEMYTNYSKSLQLYIDGLLLIEYLLTISSDKDDQDTLKNYISAFNGRISIVNRRYLNSTTNTKN